ncbi:uncharacterized protein [Epargyreus clarus]|uniref:uncharacterized protein n=1 Tax=Epargyreus clarus TaxID=520877 RepID=UPI003C2AB976
MIIYFCILLSPIYAQIHRNSLKEVFAWKQLTYDVDGVIYSEDSEYKKGPDVIHFSQDLTESEKYFIQYNNVPIGFEVYKETVFVTVPRRRYGIPSTLNYALKSSGPSPALKPYPDAEESKDLVSVYRPRVDACDRLWMVDTGLLEVPNERKQVQKPAIIIYDLKTNKRILKYELKDSDLVNERTPGGLTSITVDVTKQNCDDAFAYINDLATAGMVVFSLKQMDSWRYQDESFKYDPMFLNFTVAGYVINWKDNIFGIALSDPDPSGRRTVFYHPLVSDKEYAVDTEILKKRKPFKSRLLGSRGNKSQSGSSSYHAATGNIFYANVAQDAILCWDVNTKMAPENVGIAAQDHDLLVYISDLKVIGDEVWVLVNQIPRFVFSNLNVEELNFYIHRYLFMFLLGTILKNSNLGKFREVFKWKQLTFNINGENVSEDRATFGNARVTRQSDRIIFPKDKYDPARIWGQMPFQYSTPTPTSTSRPSGNPNDFFIQYNNVPMGVERVDDRVFITVPRRRYGIPSTLNYIDLANPQEKSPPLKPYPDFESSKTLVSVYRTRADKCGRLWMVDTGLLEIPGNPQQVQTPSIVIYDLRTDTEIFRYPFKSADIPAANTPTGLASITVDIDTDCGDAYAYIPDLTTYGLIVFSLRQNDSWRLSHNYFYFNPVVGNLRIADQSFQWSDGIFSITLTPPGPDGCKTAYFHPMVSLQEFSVSTCLLKNRTAATDSNSWSLYNYVGDRGNNTQSTMHEYDPKTGVVFFAEIGRDSVSCWQTAAPLAASSVVILARDARALSYPSDLHVTNGEVWVMANSLPRFGYSSLDTNEFNFFVYKGNVPDLIAGTPCANRQ